MRSPREVTAQQMNDAIQLAVKTTAGNSKSIAPLNILINDPPTQNDVEQIYYKLNDLINALYHAS